MTRGRGSLAREHGELCFCDGMESPERLTERVAALAGRSHAP